MKKLGYGRDYRYAALTLALNVLVRSADIRARLERYDPGFAHPVYQPFLPPELVSNPASRFLKDDDDIEGKTIDEDALREWESQKLGGERWQGREELERKLREQQGGGTETWDRVSAAL